jgi:hypothetical protein
MNTQITVIIFISKKYSSKYSKIRFDRSDRSGICLWSNFFKTNIMMVIQVFILFYLEFDVQFEFEIRHPKNYLS